MDSAQDQDLNGFVNLLDLVCVSLFCLKSLALSKRPLIIHLFFFLIIECRCLVSKLARNEKKKATFLLILTGPNS